VAVSTLELHLVTPEREVWSGPATMVSAHGVDGDVGIMPFHAPMLIRLNLGVLGVKTEDSEFRAIVDGGFLHVSTTDGVSRVDVLAEHAELEDEIDLEAARRDAEHWEARVQELGTEEAKLGLARALARVTLKG
jgi:F-type H+-transporting ATPase subunit epsilon